MKRGLVVLDPAELPVRELEQRVADVQRALTERGIAAALIYGDVYHSGDITYLSNICIYWNEGLLVVPAAGAATFVSKISARTHKWMRATSNLTQLRSGPGLAQLVAETLAELPDGPVGLVEEMWWPGQVLRELRGTLTSRQMLDLGPLVRRSRQSPSPVERALIERGAAVTVDSLAAASVPGLTLKERAGVAEKTARLGGVEDVTVTCSPAASDAATVDVVAEFRGYWTSGSRLLSDKETDWSAAFRDAYAAASAALVSGSDRGQVAGAATQALADVTGQWRLDLMQHTDIETNGGYRTAEQASAPVSAGDVVGLRLELDLPGGTQAVLADTYVVDDDRSRCLTAAFQAKR